MSEFVGTVLTLSGFPRGIKVTKLLGEGGFAFVYQAINVVTGAEICLKRMIIGMDPRTERVAKQEIAILEKFSGMNQSEVIAALGKGASTDKPVVHMYCAEIKGSGRNREAFMVMEFCSGGHLFDMVRNMAARRVRFEVKEACHLMIQISGAVALLHNMKPAPVTHRDLKLENVLVGADGRTLKLCDFGSCAVGATPLRTQEERSHQEEVIEKNTTQMYRAPEMCDLYIAPELNEKVDVWALGGLFFAMLYQVHPFQEAGNLGILSGNWRQALPKGADQAKVMEKFSPFNALFERMFVKVVGARASVDEVSACLRAITAGRPLPPRPESALRAQQAADAAELELQRRRQAKLASNKHGGLGGTGLAPPVAGGSSSSSSAQPPSANSAAGRRLMMRGGRPAPPAAAAAAAAATPAQALPAMTTTATAGADFGASFAVTPGGTGVTAADFGADFSSFSQAGGNGGSATGGGGGGGFADPFAAGGNGGGAAAMGGGGSSDFGFSASDGFDASGFGSSFSPSSTTPASPASTTQSSEVTTEAFGSFPPPDDSSSQFPPQAHNTLSWAQAGDPFAGPTPPPAPPSTFSAAEASGGAGASSAGAPPVVFFEKARDGSLETKTTTQSMGTIASTSVGFDEVGAGFGFSALSFEKNPATPPSPPGGPAASSASPPPPLATEQGSSAAGGAYDSGRGRVDGEGFASGNPYLSNNPHHHHRRDSTDSDGVSFTTLPPAAASGCPDPSLSSSAPATAVQDMLSGAPSLSSSSDPFGGDPFAPQALGAAAQRRTSSEGGSASLAAAAAAAAFASTPKKQQPPPPAAAATEDNSSSKRFDAFDSGRGLDDLASFASPNKAAASSSQQQQQQAAPLASPVANALPSNASHALVGDFFESKKKTATPPSSSTPSNQASTSMSMQGLAHTVQAASAFGALSSPPVGSAMGGGSGLSSLSSPWQASGGGGCCGGVQGQSSLFPPQQQQQQQQAFGGGGGIPFNNSDPFSAMETQPQQQQRQQQTHAFDGLF